MTKKVTVVYRVDDVVQRKDVADAVEAIRLWDLLVGQMHSHWVMMRDRQTGGTMSWRASGRAS